MSIKELRQARGYSQTRVAEELGVQQPYYSRIERGVANPTLEKLRELARIYGVTVGDVAMAIPERPATVRPRRRTRRKPG